MDAADTEQERYLGECLFSELPGRLLVVGELPEILLNRTVAGVEVLRLDSLSDAEAMSTQLVTQPSQDVSVPESLVLQLNTDSSDFQHRIGRAVRAFPHRVLVHVQVSEEHSSPADDVFFALGFRRLIVMPASDNLACEIRWFEYRLSQYKVSPEWLNARFWANPERFDCDEDTDDYDDEFEDDDEEE